MSEIVVLGTPQGKDRARTVRINGKTISYTPKKTKHYEELIRTTYLANKGEYFDDKPVIIYITAHYPIPKSNTKIVREKKQKHEILPCVKVDIDNLCKVVFDALNKVAYKDDKQIVCLYAKKLYSLEPKIIVRIDRYEKKS